MICKNVGSQLHTTTCTERNHAHIDDTNSLAAIEFLEFIKYTTFEVLGPEFHVSGDSVTYTISELTALYQEMRNNGEAYLRYLDKQHQEEPDYGSS